MFEKINTVIKVVIYRVNNTKNQSGIRLGLMLFVFILYAVYSMQFNGPFILADELGYITKAMAISGVSTDAASSWQAGYSLLISPIFFIIKNPDLQWKAIIIVNAIMWSCSAGLLFSILKKYFPKKNPSEIVCAVLLTMFYPSYVSASGYSFATSAFVFALILTLTALLKSRFELNKYLLIFSILAGYLYWIHPTSLILIMLAVAVLFVKMIERKNVEYLFPIILLILIPLAYLIVVKPWFNLIMTPADVSIRNHYDDFYLNIGSRIALLSFWTNALGVFIGQIAYLLVASFGAIAFSLNYLMTEFRGAGIMCRAKKIFDDTERLIVAILIITIFGVALMTALYFPADILPLRGEQWIYGRYVEMYAALLIGVGILSKWNKKVTLYASMTVILVALIFCFILTNVNTVQDPEFFGVIVYMWPSVFSNTPNISTLLTIGGFGVLAIGLLGIKYNKIRTLWLVLPIILLSLSNMYYRHIYGVKTFDGYSEMVGIIKDNYPKGTCVGLNIDANHDQIDDIGYFKFYLQDYVVRRYKPAEWAEKCSGVYISYNRDILGDMSGAKVLAKDNNDQLYLIVDEISYKKIRTNTKSENIKFMTDISTACKPEGCFNWDASSYASTDSTVGKLSDGVLRTAGKYGYLMKSDKISLIDGKYKISLKMKYDKNDSVASLEIKDVESVNFRNIKFKQNGIKYPEYEYEFEVVKPSNDVRIMIRVGDSSQIELESIKITELF